MMLRSTQFLRLLLPSTCLQYSIFYNRLKQESYVTNRLISVQQFKFSEMFIQENHVPYQLKNRIKQSIKVSDDVSTPFKLYSFIFDASKTQKSLRGKKR